MKPLVRTALVLLPVLVFVSGAAAADPDLARKAQEVLKNHCYRCHGHNGANEGGFNYALDTRQLMNRRKVVPGDPGKSRLYKRLVSDDNPMPPEDEKTRPTKDDIAVVKKWIEAGAADARPAEAKRAFLSNAEMVRRIAADLDGVAERDRRFTRYFTLAHLYNAELSADEMQSYRHGLSKLVNSLSWGRRVVVPKAIDPAGTVFRIDLRDYQWNEKVWDAVLAVNPYGVAATTDDAKRAADLSRCSLPYIRGDWFVAAASRPPLYHDVLQLPRTEQELEKLLRVDVAEDIRLERVARAGFNSSGVSRNNRLIERHEAGSVVYWKSYDFAGNTGRQNLFARPLGPGTEESSFKHDGGEIIFSLPNGLQGYYLADAAGRRLDKGPTSIVSDPKRPDRAVENGLSCMSCHAKGMIDKADQVRGHVEKNPGGFTAADIDSVRALYPAKDAFAALIREDSRRFQEAVARTGAPLSATEPIAALALRFEAELDVPLAAAEAGVLPNDLLKALDRSPALAQQLGPLRVAGGTVQRTVYVDAFPDLVRALRLGDFLTPKNAAFARLIKQGDALAEKKDTAGALKAYTEAVTLEPDNPFAFLARGDLQRDLGVYEKALADYDEAVRLDPTSALARNNRGVTYKRTGDLERALADFTEAVRLDPRLAVAYLNRGAARQVRGDLTEAVADYTEALRLDPKSALALNNRGLALLDAGQIDRALDDFTEALRLDPKSAIALNNRGLAHSRKEEYTKAVADFTEAIRLDPKFARAYFNRGIAHNKKGDADRARADRVRAVELDPNLDKEQ